MKFAVGENVYAKSKKIKLIDMNYFREKEKTDEWIQIVDGVGKIIDIDEKDKNPITVLINNSLVKYKPHELKKVTLKWVIDGTNEIIL